MYDALKIFALTAINLLFINVCATAEEREQINVVSRGDANARYAIGILSLAIEKTGKPYKINVTQGELTTMRLTESVKTGTIDVFWAATSDELEKDLLPVRIPLEKGLLGHRIFIVHKDNQHLLDNVTTLSELRKYTMGQGRGWTDSEILKANGFKVVLAPKYESLFYMVDGKRFQLFPRGVNEPFNELELRPSLDLVVDQNVMITYRIPYYLFITPGRPELAKDIESGLNMAISDGSFDAYFYNDETTKAVIKLVATVKRRIFALETPSLPPKTPLDDSKLWVNFEELQKKSSNL
jgi:hypothetical protein